MADDDPTTSVNPFAPPPGATTTEPTQLEFETPPLAPDRSAHPHMRHLVEWAERGASEGERRSALKSLILIFKEQVDELRRGQRQQIDAPLIEFIFRLSTRAIADAALDKVVDFLMPLKRGKRASDAI